MEERKMLDDYFKWDFAEDDDYIIIDGVAYMVEINLSQDIPDSECMRIKKDGEYYYFG